MKISPQGLEKGVLPQSQNFFFAAPASSRQRKLFYYISWCGRFFCTEQYCQKRKYYPFCLMIYVQSGKFHIEYRDYVFDAQAGDVVVLDCTEPHYYSAYNGLEFLYICFDGSNAHDLTQHYLSKEGPLLQSQRNQLIKNFLFNTINFYEIKQHENIRDTSMRVYKCFHLLFSHDDIGIADENNDIEKILSFIHAHISEKLSIEKLAQMMHFSVSYFSHLFKKETGLPPTEYILNVRMNQAKIMLISTDKTIEEIAVETGYASASSFANVFTNRIGCSPKWFRKLKGGLHYANPTSQI